MVDVSQYYYKCSTNKPVEAGVGTRGEGEDGNLGIVVVIIYY
jgi:hypothetical protein